MDNPQHSLDSVALRLNELADRCEAATEGQQSGLIWEAGAAIFGTDEPTDSHSAHAWFVAYAQAEAWIDSAMTLKPYDEAGQFSVFWRVGNDGDGGDPSDFKAEVLVCGMFASKQSKAVAATPALALCAAALRARAGGSNDTQP